MLVSGDIVTAEVLVVRVFGIFCVYDKQEIQVLIPEISWIASINSCVQFASPGDQLRVKIIHVDAAGGRIAGTIKGIYPDPWESNQFEVGTIYSSTVMRHIDQTDRCSGQPGYLVELVPGSYAMLCAQDISLKTGERCSIIVKEVNRQRHAVRVSLLSAEP
ncbi:S1 RNA-binding domain-containing protein [Gimesia panareensis]|uniref:S1 RNA-binding domain-containing protein n=1 Tax=Gimesia panareensis TaxID=2527978 RepID=UPI001188A562|nr:S1 RNA-binding domain-containing protein [Gimesia panareensis]QDU50346.1 30S Ribosomal protein S1 [Gimesia panareensis]